MTDYNARNENDPLNRTLLSEAGLGPQEALDLTNCDKEPIHIPGFIQPHGVLLAVTQDNGSIIVQASRNTDSLLGLDAEALLGTPMAELVGDSQLAALLERSVNAKETADLQYIVLNIEVAGKITEFFSIIHESEGLMIVELEPASADESDSTNDFEWIRTFFGRIKNTANRIEASQVAAEQVKEMLGYDRVMIYEFDEQWNGKVIAEAKEAGLEPFLGHHYPASDIPKQARELYLRNWLRTIVDVHYVPVPIIPVLQPLTGKPLNLSLSILRSVSPLHIEYLQNMGVGATTTISLIHDNKLWGLVTCHHYSPKYVPHRVRNLCNFLGAFFSSELYQRQQLDTYQTELQMRNKAARIASAFSGNTSSFRIIEQLGEEKETLLTMMEASGAAVCYQDRLMLYGTTPAPGQVRELAGWLSGRAKDYTYSTSRLSLEYEAAKAYKDKASGVMYLALSPGQQNYMIWFRPEVVEIVDWAGDPAKAVIQENDGVRLSPRKSFEKWRQVVQSTSLPWKEQHLNILPQLQSILQGQTEHQLRQAEEQALQTARSLRHNEQRYLQLMELSPVAFFMITDERITYQNKQALALMEVEKEKTLIGKPFQNYVHTGFRAALQQYFLKLSRDSSQVITGSGQFLTADGNLLELNLTLASVFHGGKPSIMAVLSKESATDAKGGDYTSATSQLQSYLATDPLTDLPNRQAFMQELEQKWKDSLQEQHPLLILSIDIDNFHAYNAVHGLKGGDLCIQSVADAVNLIARQHGGFVARFSGAAFILTLSGTSGGEAEQLAEEIRKGVYDLQIPRDRYEEEGVVTVSIGGLLKLPLPADRPADYIAAAEKALHEAKTGGKNRVVLHP
ncbi:diguanylate cyclase domain-containing protein [Paenibacillus sp. MMS20-IR301]|uniref:diguanylate cyclase domain-containing protein n=1 Tax=Paenibacillus sp. MMS20-IR301 TaxID=2895946 RepID=UPI0028E7F328|nr:diguanylate cyclase [Paenibacillus sp. MMS20-IR301]WNS45132.1 diguanylate cyclase [Paenibacillus sp. MMS20-IR301]